MVLSSIRIEVVWGTLLELVAAAHLVAQIDAERGHCHPDGEPAKHAQSSFFTLLFGNGLFGNREWFGFGGHGGLLFVHNTADLAGSACCGDGKRLGAVYTVASI